MTFLAFLMGVISVQELKAQVTTVPSPVQENTKDLKIYFHADQGNQGLMGLNANTKVYAHTGLITSKSTSDSDWKYVIADWNKDTEKAEMLYEGPNLWSLYIGDIRTFYGVTDMSEKIKKLAFVFRTSGGSREGKAAGGGDIFVTVVDPGLQIELTSSATSEIVDSSTGAITFTASATSNATLTISVNGTSIASKSGVSTLSATYTFPSVGDYTVTATATSGNETASDTLSFAYLNAPTAKNYPTGAPVMGPVTNADGSVTFCMAAPEMSRMILVGSWNNYKITNDQQMYYVDYATTNPVTKQSGTFRYFWITVPDLGKTNDQYVYFFKVEGSISSNAGTMKVNTNACDPYARLVLDPWNDKYIDTNVYPNLPAYPFDVVNGVPVAVYQKNINDYTWQCKNFQLPDKDNLIIYELLLRDFTGTEGQNRGNGTVKAAIEKMNYLKELGVNVIELMPICDFSGNNSWGYNPNFYFAPDKAYGTPDMYKEFIDLCHQNGMAVVLDMVFNQSDGLHPWYSMYGGNQYSPFYNYGMGGENGAPHAYSVMNDWNQGYPLVQQQWTDVIKYWMTEYNIDGFRFDLVKGLGLNESYGSASEANTNKYNASRVAEMAYLQSVIQSVKPGAYCINENLATAQEENEMAQSGELNWANVNNAGCQFAMGYQSDSNMNRLYAPQDSRTKWSTVSYLESHDEERMAYKQDQWGVAGVKGNVQVSMQRCGSAAAQMIMTPGSHMIWMFGELGKSESLTDRTGPKKVEWNLLNEPNHRGLHNNYCQLIDIRFKNPQFFGNDANFQINCSQSNWTNGRTLYSTYQDQELLTFVNPNITGSLNFTYDFKKKDNSAYQILSQSYGSESFFNAVNGTVTVPANCYVVIGSAGLNQAGVEGIEAESQSFRVRGGYGEIIIENAGNSIVYSLDGKVAGKLSGSGSLQVAKGLYIVKNGDENVKVMVK